MRLVQEADIESLLRRDVRSRLPLARQLQLYLDPFALFKDASRNREPALSYNRAMRWMLVSYLRRWLTIAASLFLAIAPAEALAAQATILPAAAFAVGFCIAVAVLATTAAAYVLLGVKRS
jgi:hypothetical protein